MITPLRPATIRPPYAVYSHGVLAPPNAQLLFASGQLGVSHDDVIPDGIEEQAILCFENIKAILAAADFGFEHVVRFSAFVTDRAYFPIYGAVRSRYVQGDAFASTLLIVSGFTLPQFKIEVEVTAARSADLPQGRASG